MCPDRETLAAYVDRRLAAAERDLFEAHLAACDACRAESVDLWRLAKPRPQRLRPARRAPWGWAAAASLAAAALLTIGLSFRSPGRNVEPLVVVHPKPLPKAETPKQPPPPPPLVVPESPRTEPPRPPPVVPAPTPTPKPIPPVVEPPPPIPEPPKPPPPATVAAIAVLDRAEGRVLVNQAPAKAGQPIRPDDLLESAGPRSFALISFPDRTRLELEGDTLLRAASAKRLIVEKGAVKAEVAKQPAGQAIVFETPHGSARVLGTVLRLHVAEMLGLEVAEGKVELKNKAGRALIVEAGKQATTFAMALKALPKEEAVFVFDARRERGPNNRLCHPGEAVGGNSRVMIDLDQLAVRGDEVLSFDYWVDPQAAQVNLHFWNSARKQKHEALVTETSFGKWTHAVLRLADLGLREGDQLGNLYVQGTGSAPRRLYVDTVQLTRPLTLKPRSRE